VPALVEALKDREARVREAAAGGLGAIGRPAKAAVPALLELRKDGDENVRAAAARAPKRIDPEAAKKAGP
jgi:HEAT repeat protein